MTLRKNKSKHTVQRSRCHFLASHYAYRLINSPFMDKDEIGDIGNKIIEFIIGKQVNIDNVSAKKHITLLNKLLRFADRTPDLTTQLAANVTMLSKCLQLNDVASEILQFSAVLTLNKGLNDLIYHYMYYYVDNIAQLLSAILDIDEVLIELALEDLWLTGLFVGTHVQGDEPLLLPRTITRKLVASKIKDPVEMLQDIVVQSPPPTLDLSHFDYLDVDFLLRYLTSVVKAKEVGINLLFYGEPGTGKTQLTRLLAQEVSAHLFEVVAVGGTLWHQENEYETAVTSGALRLQFHQLIQRLLAKTSNNLLVLDECEDLFAYLNGDDRISKEALHRLLETNLLPTIWITNHVDYIDESCLRRFNMIVEFPKPSSNSIKTLIDGTLKGLGTSPDFRNQLAGTKHLTMAHVDNAAKVIRQVGLKRKKAEYYIDTLIDSTLTACGYQQSLQYKGAQAFDLNFINMTGELTDLTQLIEATEQQVSVRALLTGVAGTGKTALVNHLAQSLDRELITVRCSDILGKYVGESEKAVAKVFKEANNANAILFIDEVDSLLASREGMSNGWEVQLVNELLTQIECFEQPFFAATNFHTRLDKAVLRRFDFKLHFTPLNSKQVLAMYRKTLSCKVIPKAIAKQLVGLTQLTPGDFAIVARRQIFSTTTMNHQQALAILVQENNRKAAPKSIGFV